MPAVTTFFDLLEWRGCLGKLDFQRMDGGVAVFIEFRERWGRDRVTGVVGNGAVIVPIGSGRQDDQHGDEGDPPPAVGKQPLPCECHSLSG